MLVHRLDLTSLILAEGSKPFLGLDVAYLQIGHLTLIGVAFLASFVSDTGLPLTDLPDEYRGFLQQVRRNPRERSWMVDHFPSRCRSETRIRDPPMLNHRGYFASWSSTSCSLVSVSGPRHSASSLFRFGLENACCSVALPTASSYRVPSTMENEKPAPRGSVSSQLATVGALCSSLGDTPGRGF